MLHVLCAALADRPSLPKLERNVGCTSDHQVFIVYAFSYFAFTFDSPTRLPRLPRLDIEFIIDYCRTIALDIGYRFLLPYNAAWPVDGIETSFFFSPFLTYFACRIFVVSTIFCV